MKQNLMEAKNDFTQEQAINERTRLSAADALATSLKPFLETNSPFSEIQLRDAWLLQLRKNDAIFPDGWYIPPPHGIGVLIGNATKQSRTNYDSLRKFPPSNSTFFNANHNLIYVYASPVDKQTGIIGDIGATFYKGTDPIVQKHLKNCLKITKQIAEKVEIGMSFAEIYNFSMQLAQTYNFVNEIISTTDKNGTNIGHTVPNGFAYWSAAEQKIAQKGDWNQILNIISKKRVFVNVAEHTKVEVGTMITLEPRFTIKNNSAIPMASYHIILQIGNNGEKRLLTNFDTLFEFFGMHYMLS